MAYMTNPFIGTPEEPFHMSVGVILLNEKNEVLVHKFNLENNEELRYELKQHIDLHKRIEYYSLMTETPEDGESLLGAAERGLLEEFGATGELVHYIGANIGHFKRMGSDVLIEKTTPFFLYRMTSLDETKRDKGSIEASSELVFLDIDTLMRHLEAQDTAIHRTDLQYNPILKRVKDII
jgi:hypothetical protein